MYYLEEKKQNKKVSKLAKMNEQGNNKS